MKFITIVAAATAACVSTAAIAGESSDAGTSDDVIAIPLPLPATGSAPLLGSLGAGPFVAGTVLVGLLTGLGSSDKTGGGSGGGSGGT
ncbi:hypothetical protein [Octadecabacter antarcticus]|uniref:hypothetical protein n=1 Tax=Octadecabacter antarcticus TaxID=1217908 RepID=UPI0001806604|nr:hypothetical protein [Octadecabacter antarcticus]